MEKRMVRKRVIFITVCLSLLVSYSFINQGNIAISSDNSNYRLNQLYQEYEKLCNSSIQDPRLINKGYYTDSKDGLRAFVQSVATGQPVTAQDIATQRYQAQVANQYGMPYEQVQAAQQERMPCLNALKRSQIDYETILMMKNNGATNAEIVRFAEINAVNNHSYALQNQNMNVNVNHSGTVNTNVYHSGSVDVNHSGTINHNVNQNVNLNGTMYHRW